MVVSFYNISFRPMKKIFYLFLVIIFISPTALWQESGVIDWGTLNEVVVTAKRGASPERKQVLVKGKEVWLQWMKKHKKPQTENTQTENTNTSTESYKWQWMDLSCFWNWGGKCGINVYTILWIKKSNPNVEVETFVQDIVLSATMFFGTVLSIVIFFSGLIYIFSAIKWAESLQSKAKKWIIGWIIGLLLVSGSFAIVRFIQFLAQGGG